MQREVLEAEEATIFTGDERRDGGEVAGTGSNCKECQRKGDAYHCIEQALLATNS